MCTTHCPSCRYIPEKVTKGEISMSLHWPTCRPVFISLALLHILEEVRIRPDLGVVNFRLEVRCVSVPLDSLSDWSSIIKFRVAILPITEHQKNAIHRNPLWKRLSGPKLMLCFSTELRYVSCLYCCFGMGACERLFSCDALPIKWCSKIKTMYCCSNDDPLLETSTSTQIVGCISYEQRRCISIEYFKFLFF